MRITALAAAFFLLLPAAWAGVCTVCHPQDGHNGTILPRLVWNSPAWAGSAPVAPLGGRGSNGFQIRLSPGRPWSAAVASLPVDVDATPILAVSVTNLSPGSGWVLKLDDAPYDPAHPREIVTTPAGGEALGRYLVDLREISRGAWHGRKQIDVRLFVTGPPSGATVTFSQIALLPGVKAGNAAKSLARVSLANRANAAAPQLVSGAWTARYVPATRRIQLSRADATDINGSAGVLSIFLPGITNGTGPVVLEAERGRNITSKCPAMTSFILRTTTDTCQYEAKVTAYTPRDVGSGDGNKVAKPRSFIGRSKHI